MTVGARGKEVAGRLAYSAVAPLAAIGKVFWLGHKMIQVAPSRTEKAVEAASVLDGNKSKTMKKVRRQLLREMGWTAIEIIPVMGTLVRQLHDRHVRKKYDGQRCQATAQGLNYDNIVIGEPAMHTVTLIERLKTEAKASGSTTKSTAVEPTTLASLATSEDISSAVGPAMPASPAPLEDDSLTAMPRSFSDKEHLRVAEERARLRAHRLYKLPSPDRDVGPDLERSLSTRGGSETPTPLMVEAPPLDAAIEAALIQMDQEFAASLQTERHRSRSSPAAAAADSAAPAPVNPKAPARVGVTYARGPDDDDDDELPSEPRGPRAEQVRRDAELAARMQAEFYREMEQTTHDL